MFANLEAQTRELVRRDLEVARLRHELATMKRKHRAAMKLLAVVRRALREAVTLGESCNDDAAEYTPMSPRWAELRALARRRL